MIVRTASSLNVLKFREEHEEQKDFDPKAHAVAVEAARRSLGVASPAASGRDATGRPEFFSRFTHETQEMRTTSRIRRNTRRRSSTSSASSRRSARRSNISSR